MLKMYHLKGPDGGSAAYWENAWTDGAFDEALRFCEVDPLAPIFNRYATPGDLMLEGGCGRGHYVAYYTAHGLKVVGLDFALQALVDLHNRDQQLPLCAGDVARLPFCDEVFDVYYSGGVVEHFEAGAEPSLDEAWCVLRPGGRLLISVPYFSPLRRAVSRIKTNDRRRVAAAGLDSPTEKAGRQFFQYAYTTGQFKRLLSSAGFRVIATQGYSIIWGLYELPLVEQAMVRLRQQWHGGNDLVPATPTGSEPAAANGGMARPSLLKRLVIAEDASVPVAGGMVRALRWLCANMMMYVCVRETRPEKV